MLQHYHGGSISDCDRDQHVATTHAVTFTEHAQAYGRENGDAYVNSYHGQGVLESEIAADLIPLAVTADGWVEGVVHKGRSTVAGVQWHPERQHPHSEFDRTLVRRTFQCSEGD